MITNTQKRIHEIDPELKYIKTLKKKFGAEIFLVKQKRKRYVLKSQTTRDELCSERKGLVRAEGVSGITHLVRNYGEQETYDAILKEYFPGKDFLELHEKISDTNHQRKLEQTVRDFHSLGIASLDIARRNIVLSPDKKEIKIIDFGFCKFKEDISAIRFETLKNYDFRCLEENCFV